jgi:hypothetical protein
MDKIPILRIGGFRLVSIQIDLQPTSPSHCRTT